MNKRFSSRTQFRGPDRGPNGDRTKNVFFKLLKDGDAQIRNKSDASRFVAGMVSFSSKTDMLHFLDDNRNHGRRRLQEVIQFMEREEDVNDILIPMISCIMDDEISRPLYKRARIRIIAAIYNVQGLLSLLSEPDILDNLPPHSLRVICSLLELMVMTLVEARSCDKVLALAKALRAHRIHCVPGAKTLCDLLLIDDENSNETIHEEDTTEVACWISDLRPPGGRHGNDYKNYRDIQLLPTEEEIHAKTKPWLPLASQENAFIENKELRMLDSNFRLMREDAMSSIRSNILEGARSWSKARILGLSHTYEDTKKAKVQRLSFLVQLGSSYARSKNDWSRSRSLPFEGVIALCDPTNQKRVRRFGTITTRIHEETDKWLNDPSGPIIGVSFRKEDVLQCLQESFQNMSVMASRGSKTIKDVEDLFLTHILIEASGSFFSYEPILSALQELQTVPLAHELVYMNTSPRAPEYLPRRMRMPNTPPFNGFICDLDNWSNQDIVHNTSLDESQADALRCAFSSKVALIQGPPGTGKTFIGALIAKMLRENTDESILCVCYTNHALDQFLEHLYDNGEKRLVRIGGRSQSNKLQKYNLKELIHRKISRASNESCAMKRVYAQLYQCQEEIDILSSQLKEPITWNSPHGGLSEILAIERPEIYDHFVSIEAMPDGFSLVGKNNKKVTSSDCFQKWADGCDCPTYLEPYFEINSDFDNIWRLDKSARANLIDEWRKMLSKNIHDRLKDAILTFEELSSERQAINSMQAMEILEGARVIGATTNGAAKYREILKEKSSSVVIVEEAGEVLEPHIITSLSEESLYSKETKHLILIGDHLQLRPKVECYELSTASQRGYNFDISLFERLIKSHFPSTMLRVQHRMRPYISNFIRQQTYPTLIDHPTVTTFENIKGVPVNVAFVTHNNPESGGDSIDKERKTKSNEWEASMCVEIVRYILLQGYRPDQITILTPYIGQVIEIMKAMKMKMKDTSAYVNELDQIEMDHLQHDIETVSTDIKKAIRCSSVDNFQGEECDIIVVSLVRSNSSGNIGFLKEAQRVNVLLSRAKLGLYIIGNVDTLKKSAKGVHVWNPVIETLKNDNALLQGFPTLCQLHPEDAIVHISDHTKFREVCPNGGCVRPCTSRLECGHTCPMACHPTDRSHLIAHKLCLEPCKRIPPKCSMNHPCPKRCNQNCGPCKAKVDPIILHCGHELLSPYCSDVCDEAAIKSTSKNCSSQIKHTFPCGHIEFTTCKNAQLDPTEQVCPALCGITMDCDHVCQKRCHDCEGNHSCELKCDRVLICGHTCETPCHGQSPCPPCENSCGNVCIHSKCEKKCSSKCSTCVHECEWECSHQGRCNVVCGAPCTRLLCQLRCDKKLSCGHQCPSVCGEICPNKMFCQECCEETKKSQTVDMIELKSYKDCNLNKDPIIVLPCQHFYTMSTCDGIFDISEAYEFNSDGICTGTKYMSHRDDIKPKCCPECRAVLHSVRRYGRIISFLRLRFLEHKHLISINQKLKICARSLEQSETKELPSIIKRLKQLMTTLKDGPTQRVFEACGGNTQIEVPTPSHRSIIQTIDLIGTAYSRLVEKYNDDNYINAINALNELIEVCDATQSIRMGGTARISLSKLVLGWSKGSDETKIKSILDPILKKDFESKFKDLYDEATSIMNQSSQSSLQSVIKAMHKIDNYDYGGSWSSHWYECPNGHPYFIGNCGGAMETARCIECGELVGGTGHQLVSSNGRSATVARILNKY